MTLGGVLTAMVTPFDRDGAVAEDAAAALMRHLLDNGSDGLVVAGTTGEGSTLTDDEKVGLWEIAAELSGEAPVVAGTGSNDTRHTVELTERAALAGADYALVVAPYYNRPDRRGLLAHFTTVADASPIPIVLYNIPQRSAVDMPNDLLAELGRHERIVAVKQARTDETLAAIEGLDLLAGNDDALARVMDLGGSGGILVAAHLVAAEMRRIVAEPDGRHEAEAALAPLYAALTVAPLAVSVKAALRLLGHDVGGVRLPYVDVDDDGLATIRSALEAQGLLQRV